MFTGQGNHGQTLGVKGEQGTAELGTKTVMKQTNELFLDRQKLPFPFIIGQSKWLGALVWLTSVDIGLEL